MIRTSGMKHYVTVSIHVGERGCQRVFMLCQNLFQAMFHRAQVSLSLPITYVWGAGGRDPRAHTPVTTRSDYSPPATGSDCVGLAMWISMLDRFNPTFPIYGGWMNTDSIAEEARTKGHWYRVTHAPEPGDLVLFTSLYVKGKLVEAGHIGFMISPTEVVHCHGHSAPGHAVSIAHPELWLHHPRGLAVTHGIFALANMVLEGTEVRS